MPQILATKEVAEYLKLHEITVCKYAAEGKIPAIRIGRVWRFVFLKRIDRAAFVLLDPDSNKLTGIVSNLKKTKNHGEPAFCVDVVKQVIETKRPFAVSNVETEEESSLVDTLKVLKIQSVMCVPLMPRSRLFGIVYVDSLDRPYGFRWDDLLLFADFNQRLALLLENACYASELLAVADALSYDDEEGLITIFEGASERSGVLDLMDDGK